MYKKLLFLAAVLTAITPASATISFVGNRSSLGPDFIDWGQLGVDLTEKTSPFTATSNLGLVATVTQGTTVFDAIQEGDTWTGNFAVGSNLLFCCDLLNGPSTGPYSISFSSPVQALGMQFQSLDFGTFTAFVTAFDAGNTNLGSVQLDGTSNNLEDNSAIFVGLQSNLVNIARIQLDVTVGGLEDPFSINTLSIGLAGVPEPSTIGLGLAGLVWIAAAVRKRSRLR